MGQVFLLAVVSALDAGLLTAAVVLLGRPRPTRRLGAYLIGGIGFSIIRRGARLSAAAPISTPER